MGRKKLLSALVSVTALFGPDDGQADEALSKIKTIVVIYAENRSFDHLYGFFPGANGIANATAEARIQLDHDGKPLPYLVIFGPDGKPNPRFPKMPNGPFQIDSAPINGAPDMILPSPIHAFYHNQEQINGGRNNMFAAMSTVGGWVMGYFGDSRLRMMEWATQYTLADNFFMGAFGGSYLNHQYLICACTPRHPNAPDGMRARLDPDGRLTKKHESPSATVGAVQVYSGGLGGQVTPDGYSVNTTQPPYVTITAMSFHCGLLRRRLSTHRRDTKPGPVGTEYRDIGLTAGPIWTDPWHRVPRRSTGGRIGKHDLAPMRLLRERSAEHVPG
jgi:hypothetical protein